MTDDWQSTPPAGPGWWQRFRRWLAGPQPGYQPPGRYIPEAPTTEFTTPALGDAYDFPVRIRWAWTGGRWNNRDLALSVEPLKADVWEKITVATRCVLRTYPPHQPAEAEAALNRRLDEIVREGQVAGAAARWIARAEVGLPEAVREQQQRAWLRRLQQAADAELSGIIVDDYTAMTRKWRDLLAQVGIGDPTDAEVPAFVGRYLVRLAADPQAAPAVVDALAERRERKDQELLQVITGAIDRHDQVNMLEAYTAYDSALRRLMDWAGLPLPDIGEEPWPAGVNR